MPEEKENQEQIVKEENDVEEDVVCDECGSKLFIVLFNMKKLTKQNNKVFVGIKRSAKIQCCKCHKIIDTSTFDK